MSREFSKQRYSAAQWVHACARRLAVEMLEDRSLLSAVAGGLSVNPQAFAAADILVDFKPGNAPAKVLPAGATEGEALPLVPGLFRVDLRGSLTVERALAALRADPRVQFAEPDYQVHADTLPSDPSFGVEWGLNNTGQSGGTVDADIDAPEAWDIATGKGSVTVAIIDTGVDYNHPDLAANIWSNPGEISGDGQDNDGNGFIDDTRGWDFANGDNDPFDDNSHGTHVAGTIGAVGNNGLGVAGIDWNVKIMPLKFLDSAGSGSTSNAILALNYAVSMGASISNNSWGGAGFSQSLYNAINNARSAGHIFVAAAGNNTADNDSLPFYPASYALPNVVSVAATDRYDNLASFSNFGATSVDLGAPGVSIYSTTPGNTYAYKSGTSMATPHVAGALALLRDAEPGLSASEAINRILTTADPLPALAGKTVSGGRLNIARALGGAAQPLPPALAISNVSITESNAGTTSANFTVSLTAASFAAVTVDWSTADGTATAGNDYLAASNTLTFAPGQTSQTISVLVSGDTDVEPNETFFVNLSNPSGATISDGQGVGTIVNDDIPPPTLSINDVTVTEGNTGTVSALFTVSLTAASSTTVTVDYATANGTATADNDYMAGSGTLTFTPGLVSQTIAIAVNGDTDVEPNETFVLNLSNPSGATIADGQGVGTILNDDIPPPPTLSINSVSVLEGNSGSANATFIVTLSQPSLLTVTVNYATTNGTAKNGSDYLPQSGSLSFAPGETSKTISVKIKSDTTAEPDETFFVNLSSPLNATLAAGQGVGTILNDDGPSGAARAQQADAASLLLSFVTDTSGSAIGAKPRRAI